MQVYNVKTCQLTGSTYKEIIGLARHEYHRIQKLTPRRVPYVRSKYFRKDKIFINNFWDHLSQKSAKERTRRLKLYSCAIELIRNTDISPVTAQNPHNKDEVLHRFFGLSAEGKKFVVQIKSNNKTNRKDFISVFPKKQQ